MFHFPFSLPMEEKGLHHVCSNFFCSKKLFTAVHNFVHLNLAIALFIGYLTFAVGVELAKDDEVYTLYCQSPEIWGGGGGGSCTCCALGDFHFYI